MKNKLSTITTTLLLLLATICTTQAQWTATGSNVYTTGKVGIGMNAPLYTLDISGGGVSTAINHLSGSATSHTQYALGRTAVEGRISIASSAGDFTTDAVAGDFILRTEAAGRKILFNTNAGIGASTMAIAGNNVGIGIAAPISELHVKANGSANSWADVTFESTAGKQWSLSGRDDRFTLVNWTNPSTSKDYLTILDGSGYVGIGKSNLNPITELDVRGISGRITCDAIYFYGSGISANDGLPITRIEDVFGMRFRADNDGHRVFSSQTSILAGYAPDGTTDYGLGNIVASGKIGIGTKTPGVYLDIADVGNAAGTRFVNVGNDASLTDVDVPNILGVYGQQDGTQGGIELGSSGPTIFGSNQGNVGIGTTTPSALLHVAGGDLRVDGRIAIGGNLNTLPGVALSVNGSIYSKATYVTVNGWSDNIFDSEYQLKDLDEVEEYIKKNKHLPSIPSEKEIMEKGLDTGEMLRLQMAKIEELTLYMIELKKENKAMKEENQIMKKAINTLEEITKK